MLHGKDSDAETAFVFCKSRLKESQRRNYLAMIMIGDLTRTEQIKGDATESGWFELPGHAHVPPRNKKAWCLLKDIMGEEEMVKLISFCVISASENIFSYDDIVRSLSDFVMIGSSLSTLHSVLKEGERIDIYRKMKSRRVNLSENEVLYRKVEEDVLARLGMQF